MVYIIELMEGSELVAWREKWKFTQRGLALALRIDVMTISRWERGVRGIPPFFSFVLEALEHRLNIGGKDGLINGMPGVQKAE
jgi:transcriptional regulator with XRE-family HTH domain